MELYDGLIGESLALLAGRPGLRLELPAPDGAWPDDGEGSLVLKGEMAYELGGGKLPAVSFFAPSSSASFAGAIPAGDEAWLYGPDLPEIGADAPFARLAIVSVRDERLGEGEAMYKSIRDIEHARYRVNPRGYMARISAAAERESVRVGREALKAGLDFAQVAGLLAAGYRRHPAVIGVRLVFITQPDFPWAELARLAARAGMVTESLDHILRDFAMDCVSCRLKPLCDEVEGMRELHLSRAKKN